MSGGPLLPTAIGRYRPVSLLGSGAMGRVFKAHDPAIGRMVAIKVIRTDALQEDMRDEYIERFKREVQAAGRCSHAAIAGVFDFSDDAENPYIVMEMIEGVSLHQMLRDPARRQQPAPWAAVVPLLAQVLGGLGYAHRLGITHRDIKPGNVLITGDGRAKIVDFGIARLADGSITQAGSMLGTPSYMAPEQVSDADVDWRADLFAVGAMLYESITGVPPFAGRTLSETILRLSLPEPAAMAPVEAAGAGHLVPILQAALAKRREDRVQSAEAFAAALTSGIIETAPADHTVLFERDEMPPPFMRLPSASRRIEPSGEPSLQGRWDPALLQRIERALAAHVGPMARVMLREAARTSATAEELVQALARSLSTTADRTQFLRALRADRVEPTLGEPTLGRETASPMARTLSGAQAVAISGPAVDAAQAALVVHVGPMARVLARKAAAEAKSPRDFIERLCAHVPKQEDNNVLRRRLQADVEPKLR